MNGRITSGLIVAALMCVAGYAALFIAPDERTMHAAQRIFYFHVSSWVAMFVALSYIGLRQYRLFDHPLTTMGLACCRRRRTWRGVLHDWANHWSPMGQTGLGHLVDVGWRHGFENWSLPKRKGQQSADRTEFSVTTPYRGAWSFLDSL